MIKAVIFDLDGTLIDSVEDLAVATNFALGKSGYPIHPTESYKTFVGDGVLKLIERAVPMEVSEEDISIVKEYFSSYYNKHYDIKTKPYSGIRELLDELIKMDIKLSVASNKPHEFTCAIVERFFPSIFSVVMGAKDGFERKPSPQIANIIMDELGVANNETLFVGDTNIDIMTAKSAGINSVGCLWGFRGMVELMNAGANFIIEKPSKILMILGLERGAT